MNRPAALWKAILKFLKHVVLGTSAIASSIGLVWFCKNYEYVAFLKAYYDPLILTGAVWIALGGLFLVLSRRPFFSVTMASVILLTIGAASRFSTQFVQRNLQAIDLYLYTGWTEIRFFLKEFHELSIHIAIAALGVLVILFIQYKLERPRSVSRIATALVCIPILWAAYSIQGPMRLDLNGRDLFHISIFLQSLPSATQMLAQGGFLKGTGNVLSNSKSGSNTLEMPPKSGLSKKPDILVILHESIMPIDLYPVLCGGPAPSRLYQSGDGVKRGLQVETIGGGTWLSEYGLMLGLSTYYFGEGRNYVGYSMVDKVNDSFARQLGAHGYRTFAFYPTPSAFVNTGRFYKTLGFDEVIDATIMKNTGKERDRFYYKQALDRLRQEIQSPDSKPFFGLVWTVMTHAPYKSEALPGEEPKAPCAINPEWGEYARRVLFAEQDMDWLLNTLRTEFPERSFLVVSFGDHQPLLTWDLLKEQSTWKENLAVPKIGEIEAWRVKALQTFYRVDTVNFPIEWSKLPPWQEIPFLGNTILNVAGLPKGDLYRARDDLAQACAFRYATCEDQDKVLRFHDQVISADGIVNR